MSGKFSRTYNGSTIKLTYHWRFQVDDLDKSFDSRAEAEAAIDRNAAKIRSHKKVKLDLPVLTFDGKAVSISGIHAGNGNLTTKPQTKVYSNELVPNAGWLPEAIKAYHEAKQLAGRIRKLLENHAVKPSPRWEEQSHTKESVTKWYESTVAAIEGGTFEEALSRVKADPSIEL